MTSDRPEPARLHEQRAMAEGFGRDAERYDRARPTYPTALIDRIVAASPGPDLLDVGCGTGIASRLFQQADCRVLGLDVDAEMARLARDGGVDVEVARLEEWEPGGRTFDAVVAAQTWHWIDPLVGATKVAQVLRPGGRIALFWNAADVPPGLREPFADVYDRVLPDSPAAAFYRSPVSAVEGYGAFLDMAADGLTRAGGFGEPERWRYDWQVVYTRDAWLDNVATQGGHHLIPAPRQEEILAGLGEAVDAVGGEFTMSYGTVAVTAERS